MISTRGDLMARVCDVCNQEYSGEGIGYELRDDKGKLQEKCFGHRSCVQPIRDKIVNKLNEKKVK
jgi:hypothetical protein